MVCDSEGLFGRAGLAKISGPLVFRAVHRVVDAARKHSARKVVVDFLTMSLGHDSAMPSRITLASHNGATKTSGWESTWGLVPLNKSTTYHRSVDYFV